MGKHTYTWMLWLNACWIYYAHFFFPDIYQGGSFPFAWKSAIKRTLQKASTGPIHRLDRYCMFVYVFLLTELILVVNMK